MKTRFYTLLTWLLSIWAGFPSVGFAGGTEHAGEGTRGLGRGGANMTRPDDPYVMARNPAILAIAATGLCTPHRADQPRQFLPGEST